MRTFKHLIPVLSVLFLAAALPSLGLAATYYVATNGNDSYNGLAPVFTGGQTGPFRTLGRAASAVHAGDSVEIRGGMYQEASTWRTDGTEAAPITIDNYGDEAVIIDGAVNTIPADSYAFLMNITGDWYTVSDLEVRYSGGPGIGVNGGAHDTLRNITAHHNYRSGIHGGGDYCTVEGCRVYWNSTIYEYGRGDAWSSGIALGRDSHYTVARGNLVWNNWGQGLNAGLDSLVEDNASWDNMCSYYVNDAQGVVFQRNLAYVTPGNILEPYVAFQIAILVGDERTVPSRGNTFINNVAMGGRYVLSLGSGALEDCVVANNTLVNAYDPAGAAYTLRIGKGTYANVLIQNNIVIQDDGAPVAVCAATGITFGHNAWSKTPTSSVRGTGDMVADPRIARAGPISPGDLSAAYFEILSDSPARDAAAAVAAVTEDYYGTARGSRADIGAYEVPEIASPLSAAAQAAPVAGEFPLNVTFTGKASGGRAPYTYSWAFGDGGASSSQNPAHTYTSAGRFTATLTVADDSRATASSTVIINATAGSPLSADALASPAAGEAPLIVAFTGGAGGGAAPYAYRWVFGDGASSTSQSPAHTFQTAGTYEVVLTVTDAVSATAFSSVTISVVPAAPSLGTAIEASVTSGTAPLTVGFTARANGGASPYAYRWAFGDGATSTAAAPSHLYGSAGTYVAVLTVTDAKSARASASVTIVVKPTEKGGQPRGPKKKPRVLR